MDSFWKTLPSDKVFSLPENKSKQIIEAANQAHFLKKGNTTVDSKIDENRCKQIYELIQVMDDLYRYKSRTTSNCGNTFTVFYLFQ